MNKSQETATVNAVPTGNEALTDLIHEATALFISLKQERLRAARTHYQTSMINLTLGFTTARPAAEREDLPPESAFAQHVRLHFTPLRADAKDPEQNLYSTPHNHFLLLVEDLLATASSSPVFENSFICPLCSETVAVLVPSQKADHLRRCSIRKTKEAYVPFWCE